MKCRTLLYNRMQVNVAQDETVLACVFKTWGIQQLIKNPPSMNRHLQNLDYLQKYIIDMAYMTSPSTTESGRTVKKQIYSTLLYLSKNANHACGMRITRNNPGVAWQHVWRNLHNSRLTPHKVHMVCGNTRHSANTRQTCYNKPSTCKHMSEMSER